MDADVLLVVLLLLKVRSIFGPCSSFNEVELSCSFASLILLVVYTLLVVHYILGADVLLVVFIFLVVYSHLVGHINL